MNLKKGLKLTPNLFSCVTCSKNHEETINEAIREATEWGRRHAIEINDQHARELRSNQSLDIYTLSAEERELWLEALQPVYKEAEQTVGSELINEIEEIKANHAY